MKEIALRAAEEGGKILMEKFRGDLTIRHKGDIDLVTEADKAAEQAIVSVIRGTFPRHDVLAEEEDYGRSTSPYRWIIDPLDGTTNYAHGFPWFAVSIALEVSGEVALGVVLNPCSGETFYAEKGKGAFRNDVQMRVSKTESLDQSLLATGFPYDRKTSSANNIDHFSNFLREVQGCRRPGVASLDLVHVAAGCFDGYWEMKLKPWDVAAGVLMVKEAGGVVTGFAQEPCDIYGKEILASNGRIHGAMADVLKGGSRP